MDQKYIDFFLNSNKDIVELELFEIFHPSFTQVYRFVRNSLDGVTLSNGNYFRYYPAAVDRLITENNLDYGVKVGLGDLTSVLPPEIKKLQKDDSLLNKPSVNYWLYRSDDLNEPMKEILYLLMDDFSFDNSDSFFTAKAPTINNSKTGNIYSTDDFSSLKSFLT